MSRLLLAALAILVAVALAACTATTGASPSPTATPTPAAEPTPTGDGDDEPAGDEALETLIPDEVAGITLEKESMTGADVLGEEGVTPEVQAFLQTVGADVGDISAAFGFGFNADDPEQGFITISAFRVAGANEDVLLAEMQSSMEAEFEGTEVSQANLGGKDVTIIAYGDGPERQLIYLHARGDIIFMVFSSTEELAEEALSQIP